MIRKILFFIILLPGCYAGPPETQVEQKTPSPLYGITLDDLSPSSIDGIIAAIRALPVKPTARIVIDADIEPSDFIPLLSRLHDVAYIMLCPCDSYDMKRYKTAESYKERFAECALHLARYVDIWEVGNEINGKGWTGGTDALNGRKAYAAWIYAHERGFKTALTTYMFKPGDQDISMENWLTEYIPSDMKDALDYVLVSYYDEDNDGKHEDWHTMFKNLYSLFPHSALGFGECGFPSPHKAGPSFDAQADAYYLMTPYNDRYVGGYFWWNWQEDCVPHKNNPRWQKMYDNFLRMKELF
ncbi:hypothetical protein [Treponema parvum]|uniref:hypothetical protein n=1 Tax=Treponema parvum TaxID=138851 RepID=UPI001AEC4F4C|nr:hypothetical protein [Treponema parvum]QTQ17246.1 hypothetical protein HXT04_11420 [Treponema parvum]